jgi:hypothetical protein
MFEVTQKRGLLWFVVLAQGQEATSGDGLPAESEAAQSFMW